MFKSAIFFIMTFVMCLSAGARTLVRTHEDFVHLSEFEKNQHIIKVMELVVELESKYKFETRKYGYSQERFEKFQKAISKISNLFFQNAYANPSVSSSDWTGIASSFEDLLNNPQVTESNRCIFAGWISETYQSGGRTYCGHPSRSPRARAGYPTPPSGCGQNNNKIQCNPVIFGYKKVSDHSLFCVSTANSAENSSLQCMKKSLGLVTEDDSDPAADRLATLRSNLSSNPEVFNNVQEFVYRTCVCDSTHERFNGAYQSAIRPHRTCLGLMNMIGETVNCVEPQLPLQNRTIFENLRSQITQENLSGRAADAFYTQFLSGLDRSSPEYRRVCQLQPETPDTPEVTYECESATCTGSGESLACTYVVKANGQPVNFTHTPRELPVAGDSEVNITFKVNGEDGEATCRNIIRPEPSDQYQCTATCTIAAATPAETDNTDQDSDATQADPSNPSAPPPAGGEGATSSETPALGCRVTSLKDSSNQDVSYQPVSAPTAPSEPSETPVELSFVLKINNEDKTVACQTTTTRLTAGSDTTTDTDGDDDTTDESLPSLEVKIKEERESEVDIEAIYQETPGWNLNWFTKEVPPGKSVSQSWNPPADAEAEIAVSQDDSTRETSDTPAAPTSHGKNITQPRYDFDYKVCGKLVNGSRNTGDDNCVVVKKKGSGTDDADGRQFTPAVNPNLQPGGSIRGASDTSAIGIR